MVWTGQEIVTATAAAGDAAEVARMECETVCTDSRRAGPGSLFIALRGERHDAHAFLAEALRGGAAALLVERVPDDIDRRRALVVRDTLRGLGDLAAYTRVRWGGPVVAITGSNGKTTTKEMVAAICETALREGSKDARGRGFKQSTRNKRLLDLSHPRTLTPSLLKTHANENNLIGLPLTLLRLTGDEAVAVLEMGMNAPGEIARMTEIATPDVGLITNVGPAHLEGLGSVAGVAAAKGELVAGLRSDATFAFNRDDEWVVRVARDFRGRRIEFGNGGEVAASAIDDRGADGIAFTLQVGAVAERVVLRMPGRHNVQNALGAAAVAHALGIAPAAIAAGLAAADAPKMRLQVSRLANGVTVINDAYNANPASTMAAIDTLAHMPGRSIAVLGEMRELGAESAALHRQVGAHAAARGVHWLLVVGPQADDIAAGAHEWKKASSSAAAAALDVSICADAASAAALIMQRWQSGDTVLIKGSRGPDDEEGVRRYGARMAEVAARLEVAGGRS